MVLRVSRDQSYMYFNGFWVSLASSTAFNPREQKSHSVTADGKVGRGFQYPDTRISFI